MDSSLHVHFYHGLMGGNLDRPTCLRGRLEGAAGMRCFVYGKQHCYWNATLQQVGFVLWGDETIYDGLGVS